MSNNIQIENTIDLKLPAIRILLAEKSPLEIVKVRISMVDNTQVILGIVRNYDQLLESLEKEQPHLVILGNIDVADYFTICQGCRTIYDKLPIILLSNQEIVNDSFRELKSYGVIDIVSSNDLTKLNGIFDQLLLTSQQQTGKKQLQSISTGSTGQMMLIGLNEIITISNNYFGPLAQGNYWRKAHALVIDQFPFIQNWAVDHFSKATCLDSILELELTDKDMQCLRIWVQFFIEECERIIVDYGKILKSSDLSPPAQDLLSTTN